MKFRVPLIIATILLTGCVSSLLKEKIPPFSKEISFKELDSPFVPMKNIAYPSWKNNQTQNVIFIISHCDDGQPNIQNAHVIVSENVEDQKVAPYVLNNLRITKSVNKSITGYFEAEPISIKTMAFKSKECVYLSGLTGRPEIVGQDEIHWINFLNSIEIK